MSCIVHENVTPSFHPLILLTMIFTFPSTLLFTSLSTQFACALTIVRSFSCPLRSSRVC